MKSLKKKTKTKFSSNLTQLQINTKWRHIFFQMEIKEKKKKQD